MLVACGGAGTSAPKAKVDPLPSPTASTTSLVAGAPCNPEKDDWECANDHASVMRCSGARWVLAGECPGPEHCVSTKSKIKCDDTWANVGMRCVADGNMACAFDKSAVLQCTDGVMSEALHCRGAGGCSVRSDLPTCDMTISEVGDRCRGDGEAACTPDHRALVQCRDHVMVKTSACSNCTVTDKTTIDCR